ncbi:MAG: STT3 domain-containing protein [Acidobacteriota bacterium]|nr:STT3 domain-containing protein [Acidobacteriota bacterium]
MKKLDLVYLAVILLIASVLRLWAPWDDVLGSSRVNFLETDAWYHVRLVENQVRNFPHRVTVDPYASLNGQYVAVAPLLDLVIATVVVATQGKGASTDYIERVAALAPAVAGVLAVAAVWLLGTIAFDRRAGLFAGLLAAVLPGHFLDRTLVGFVDHHALEVLLSFATLACLALALGSRPSFAPGATEGRQAVPSRQELSPRHEVPIPAAAAGLFLGLYLLAWGSGAYFVAILAGWMLLVPLVCSSRDVLMAAARSSAVAAGVALVLVLALQDPALFRYNTQVVSLVALLGLSGLVVGAMLLPKTSWSSASSVSSTFARSATVDRSVALVLMSVSLVAAALLSALAPDLMRQIGVDLARFSPDPTRMAVLEARPLFLYTGNWVWSQPWVFFRSGFYVGLVAVVWLAVTVWKSRRPDHLLIVIFTGVNYAATVGQNRFGYYLVPASALVAGWLCVRVLDWGGVPHAGNPRPDIKPWLPMQRELAIVLVAGVVVAPNLVPAALTTTRAGGMADYWASAMEWLRTQTPEPFAQPGYYLARYGAANPPAAYTVMNWWDQGYWLIQAAHRVPVSNPTQGGAPQSAAFLTATDEAAALDILKANRSRFVMVDWELPFRDTGNGALAGRFQNLADWAGVPTDRFYSLCYSRSRESDAWTPSWIYFEPYYQAMAYRLMVLGGQGASPVNSTWVVRRQQRVDSTGREFCEVSEAQSYASADEARPAAASLGLEFVVVGRTPWQPAFPVPAVAGLRLAQEFRAPHQKPNESPMVRVFEVIER